MYQKKEELRVNSNMNTEQNVGTEENKEKLKFQKMGGCKGRGLFNKEIGVTFK